MMIFNHAELTIIGLIYFLVETAIISGLVYIELSVANAIKKNKTTNS
jgi:hypothetical protein